MDQHYGGGSDSCRRRYGHDHGRGQRSYSEPTLRANISESCLFLGHDQADQLSLRTLRNSAFPLDKKADAVRVITSTSAAGGNLASDFAFGNIHLPWLNHPSGPPLPGPKNHERTTFLTPDMTSQTFQHERNDFLHPGTKPSGESSIHKPCVIPSFTSAFPDEPEAAALYLSSPNQLARGFLSHNRDNYTSRDSELSSSSDLQFQITSIGSCLSVLEDVSRPEPRDSSTPVELRHHPARLSAENMEDNIRIESQPSPILLEKEWLQIEQLRMETWTLRSRLQTMRKELRVKQYEKSTADERFFRRVRMREAGLKFDYQDMGVNVSTENLLNACQQARDEYGPLEDDCNMLEDQLSSEEYKLAKVEESIYNKLRKYQVFINHEVRLESPILSASVSTDSDMDDESHPLLSEFLSALGDVDMYREALDHHMEEKFELEEEKESRELVGLQLSDDDQQWLEDYESSRVAILKQLAEAEKQSEALKQKCHEMGLVDDDGTPTSFEVQERHTFIQDTDLNAGNESSEFVKFPLLLSKPGKQELEFRETAPRVNEISHTAGDHINQWLLHQLRLSPLSVSLLARTFEATIGKITGEDWQLHVLTFWYKDGTRKGASAYRIYSSGVLTQTPRKSRPSISSVENR